MSDTRVTHQRVPIPVRQAGGGGGGGQTQDHQTSRIIVGNALNGDTAFVCDILDPGDGTGIAAALAALPATGGDIHIRPGTYDLAAGGVAPLTPTIANTRIIGAGRSTVLLGDPIQRTVFDFVSGGGFFGGLANLQLSIPTSAVGAVGSFIVNAGVLTDIVNVTAFFSGAVDASESLVGGIGTLSGVACQVNNCTIQGIANPNQGVQYACYDFAGSLHQLANNLSFGGDVGVRLAGSDMAVSNHMLSACSVGAIISGGGRNRVELVGRVAGGPVFDAIGTIFVRLSAQSDNLLGPGVTVGVRIDGTCDAVTLSDSHIWGFGTGVSILAGAGDTIVTDNHLESNGVPISDLGTLSEIAHNIT